MMPPIEPTSVTSAPTRRAQFSLLAVMMGVTAVAGFLACYCWLGNDGIALASVVVPIYSVPVLVKGPVMLKARITAAVVLLTFGVAWSILFPKSWDVLRPDTFASILFGVGLIGGGLLFAWRSRSFSLMLLCALLLWSVLLNLVMFNHHRLMVPRIAKIAKEFELQRAAAPPASPINPPEELAPMLEIDDEAGQ